MAGPITGRDLLKPLQEIARNTSSHQEVECCAMTKHRYIDIETVANAMEGDNWLTTPTFGFKSPTKLPLVHDTDNEVYVSPDSDNVWFNEVLGISEFISDPEGDNETYAIVVDVCKTNWFSITNSSGQDLFLYALRPLMISGDTDGIFSYYTIADGESHEFYGNLLDYSILFETDPIGGSVIIEARECVDGCCDYTAVIPFTQEFS